jgi:uncharacterized membrane protein YdjX (TVP38/TMEM64 family)
MDWLAPVVVRLTQLGPWAPVVFTLLYIAAALTLAPAFLLTVAAGAMFGVWRGSIIVFIAASLGATAVFGVAAPLGNSRLLRPITRDRRVAAVRAAMAGESTWIMFLLRLSPLVPYNVLNYALALSGVRYVDFAIALTGMIPAIVMYTYYGRVVGDVAALAAGVAPPRGPQYYAFLVVGLIAIVVSTSMIARAARNAVERQRRTEPGV